MTTFCDACDHVHFDTRKLPPWQWRCVKAPVEPQGFGFVTREYAPNPPYARCSDKNEYGDCDDFVTRRTKEKTSG